MKNYHLGTIFKNEFIRIRVGVKLRITTFIKNINFLNNYKIIFPDIKKTY